MTYLWVKAFHIIAVVCWFAGLFYLPRLFVYHAMTEDAAGQERFRTMERKLYRGIMNPSMIATIILGAWLLALNPGLLGMGWMHAKILLVGLLVAYHVYCGQILKTFACEANQRSHVFYRWFNEVPVLALIGVVILVEVQPF